MKLLTSNCSSGCPTPGEHESWGACVKAKNTKPLWVGEINSTTQKQWQKDIDYYRSAKRQGLNPEGSTRAQVEKAFSAAEANA